MQQKGQTAIEYLLILSSVVVIAVVVISAALGMLGPPEKQSKEFIAENKVKLECAKNCSYVITGTVCVEMGGTWTGEGETGTCSKTCQTLAPAQCGTT